MQDLSVHEVGEDPSHNIPFPDALMFQGPNCHMGTVAVSLCVSFPSQLFQTESSNTFHREARTADSAHCQRGFHRKGEVASAG